MLFTIAVSLFVLVFLWQRRRKSHSLDHIPGPTTTFRERIFGRKGNEQQAEVHKGHMVIAALRRKYGNIFKISNGAFESIVISDYDSIHEVLIKKGEDFGGRISTFKLDECLKNTGILVSYSPDRTWRTLRKIAQKHLRQFGEGLSRLELIIGDVAEDMFVAFKEKEGTSYDPSCVIFDTALNSIVYLITGERTYTGESIVEDMREYEDLFLKTTMRFAPFSFKLLHKFPWLKHFGFDKWEPYQRFVQLHIRLWETVKEMNRSNPDSDSICRVLQAHLSSDDDHRLTEDDARSAALSLLFAGVTTTSATFHAAVNILAHHEAVQDRLHGEIEKNILRTGEKPKLSDRADMPFTRAFLYELLRYTSVVAHSVHHRTTRDTTVSGHRIPSNTNVEINIWNLHHDENFWDAPYEFKPERFLDQGGEVLPADHPNRTHLLPFGAGTRVCLGEALAMARLFMWTTALVAQFHVKPAPGNLKSSTDAREFSFSGVLKSPEYKVVFTTRD